MIACCAIEVVGIELAINTITAKKTCRIATLPQFEFSNANCLFTGSPGPRALGHSPAS
jgi:hypothetical protein